jgi:Anti-sigma-K factor rskA
MTEPDNEHVAPDLVGLLTGEPDRATTLATALHLENCLTCQHELSELVVAHAALRSSERVTRRLGADIPTATFRNSGSSALDAPAPETDDALPPLPTPSILDERRGVDAGDSPKRSGPMWRQRRLVAASVIALLVAAGVLIGLVVNASTPATQSPVASATLHPIAAPTGTTGSVAVFATGSTRSLTVAAAHLPVPVSQHFYEVWLLDPSSGKMLPMGVLAPSGRGTYAVSAHIMAGYSAVDISLQANDGNPAHSATSVLRAHL